jgi:hypothetical protein
MTAMAAQLPREDLALMATIIDELSYWEREALLPFMAMDIRHIKFWLSAGIEEFGLLDSAKHRRRSARADFFRAATRGQIMVNQNYLAYSHAPLAMLFSAYRQLFFWTHLGPPAGPRQDQPFLKNEARKGTSALATLVLFLLFLFSAMAFDMNRSSLDMDHPSLLVSLVGPGVRDRALAIVLPLFALLRAGIFLSLSDTAKLAGAAQGSTPLAWRSLIGLRAYFEQRAESSRAKKAHGRSMKYDAIRAAITRASLGQGPTPEEIEYDRLADIQNALRDAALQAASNPDLALARLEQSLLERDSPPDATRHSKSL